MSDWNEKVIAEFDAVDQKGFAFRYPQQGGENCRFDFPWLFKAMEARAADPR